MTAPLLTGCTNYDARGNPVCPGLSMEWTRDGGAWHGRCPECSLSVRASTTEAAQLDARRRLDEEQTRG